MQDEYNVGVVVVVGLLVVVAVSRRCGGREPFLKILLLKSGTKLRT
jgi:hypothetical protein